MRIDILAWEAFFKMAQALGARTILGREQLEAAASSLP